MRTFLSPGIGKLLREQQLTKCITLLDILTWDGSDLTALQIAWSPQATQ